jgi:hypothetical protein
VRMHEACTCAGMHAGILMGHGLGFENVVTLTIIAFKSNNSFTVIIYRPDSVTNRLYMCPITLETSEMPAS